MELRVFNVLIKRWSSKLIGEVIFKIDLLKSEKIKVKVYVNQRIAK